MYLLYTDKIILLIYNRLFDVKTEYNTDAIHIEHSASVVELLDRTQPALSLLNNLSLND